MPPSEKTVKVASLFVPEIKELLEEKNFLDTKRLLRSISPADLAETWRNFSSDEQKLLFRLLSERAAISLFQEVETVDQSLIVKSLTAEAEPATMSETPPPSDGLFHTFSPKVIKAMSRLVSNETPEGLTIETLGFPAQSVGSWMHTQRVVLQASLTSSQTLDRIRNATRLRKGGGPDGYYVTDKSHRVVGYVSLRELIAAPSRTKLVDYMSPVRLVLLRPLQDQEEAIQLFTRYKLSMAPVVDENERLLGYIQAEDVIPLVQKESTEDIQKLGGVEALDEPYFKIAFTKMVKKRGAWLCVLFVGEMLTATAMGFFEDQIARAVVLALFIPLIISSGGNSGSQAATLIVRAVALKEVGLGDWWRVMRREFATGLALGLILGVIGFLRIFLWSQFTNIYGDHYMLIAATVGAALVLVVLWGSLSGSLLPLILSRLGLDPAVVSAPFVATLVDVTGLVIYFTTALFFLRGTVL